jgi:hypothetical protein
MSIVSLDHIVLVVADLGRASAEFSSLGFTVTPGGKHKDIGTHNALIGFADGSYLELIAFTSVSSTPEVTEATVPPAFVRVGEWKKRGPGLVDFALLPSNISADMTFSGARGLALSGPLLGGRVRPDGVQVFWQFGFPDAFDVPFLCADVTPRSHRVPLGRAVEHTNGSLGISRVTVAVKDLVKSSSRYAALLALDATESPLALSSKAPTPETRAVQFVVAGTRLILAAPDGPGSPLHDILLQRGEGPCALELRGGRDGVFTAARTQGARIELTADRSDSSF